MAKKKEDEEFNKQLQNLINKSIHRNYIFNLDKPNQELQNAGFPNLDIKILQKNVRKILKQHELKPQELENLPSTLDKVKAVFRSRNNENARLVQPDMNREEAVVFAVWLNNFIENEQVNEVKSGYTKEEWILEEWRKQGLLIWEKNKM